MIFETKHLRAVLAVAEHGTMTKAGRELHISQPALSQQLLLLEGRLRTPLFHRDGKRMVPTAAGQRVVACAREMVAQLEGLEDELRRIAGGQDVQLRLGTQCFTVFHWLPAVLAEFAKTYPSVDVQVVSDGSFSPERAVLEGKIDLGILNRPGEDPRLTYVPLFEDEMVVIAPPDHRFARQEFVSAADIGDEHLITYAVSPGQGIIAQAVLRPAGVRPRKVTEVQWTDAIVEFVKAGMGISVIATWAVRSHIDDGSLCAIRLTETGFRRRWSVATLRSVETPLHMRAFISLLARGPMPIGSTYRGPTHANDGKPAKKSPVHLAGS